MEPETENMTLPQATKRNGKHSRIFSGLKTKTIYKIRIMSGKGITYYYNSNVIWRTLSRLVDEIGSRRVLGYPMV